MSLASARNASVIPGLTGAVLAGGQARRMGHINKAMVVVGGKTVFDRIHSALAETCEHFIVIANEWAPYEQRKLSVFSDVIPGSGSIGGLFTALVRAPTDTVFVCACDMPFINPRLIRHLHSQLGDFDAVVPRDDHGLQPMHAVYSRKASASLEGRLLRKELKIEHFLATLNVRIVPPEEVGKFSAPCSAFFNVNTPSDLESARMLQARTG